MISVIVPARENQAVIAACLDSLLSQSHRPDEIIVVDDGSRDHTAGVVRERYPEVRLIRLEESRGFAGACAAGMEAAGGEWIAVLNADAVAHPAWLEESLAVARLCPAVSMIACRVLTSPPPAKVDSLGLKLHRSGMVFLRGHGQPDQPDERLPVVEEVFGPAGAAALYSRRMIQEVGFFEPDYFAYYEDVDLAFRGRWLGHFCLLANRARVFHLHSYSASRVGLVKRFYLHRNRLRTLLRNWPAAWFIQYFPFLLAGGLLGAAAALVHGEFRHALSARFDFFRFLRPDLSCRRRFQTRRKIPPPQIKKWLETDAREATLFPRLSDPAGPQMLPAKGSEKK